MYGYFNKDICYIYEIEIPPNAIHNENSMEYVNKDTANYETDRFIIRKIINIETKETRNKYKFDVVNCEYNYKQDYWKTYDLALQSLQFDKLRDLNITKQNDFPSVFRTYYYNGSLATEFYHNKGSIEGPYKFYELDGTLSVNCTFVNGIIHGNCIIYDEDNKFYRTYRFIEGKIHHIDSYYDYNDLDRYLIPHDLQC